MLLLLKNLLFTVVVPGTVAVYLPLYLARERSPMPGWTFGAATALFAMGLAVYTWCIWDFASFGRGTPAPIDAPKKLVVRGLYRYTRNPMYVGVLTVIFGWATLFQFWKLAAYALVVGSCFQLFIVFHEEPYLRREFGSEYEDYRARVGRWLPRIRGRRS